jgi:trimethylamine--corrinoid protein Co-methyltransferase
MRGGGIDAAHRAEKIYTDTLEAYEPPPLDDAIRQELEEYVIRRRKELGD